MQLNIIRTTFLPLYLAITFSIICIPFHSSCQIYPFQNFSVRQGLINSNVYTIVQDRTGFIWLGTDNGLSRFDGTTFKNFTLDELGLHYYISSLYAMEDGNLLLGSFNDGIYLFNTVTEQIKRISKDPTYRSNQIVVVDSIIISLQENISLDFISLKTGSSLFIDSVFINNTNIKAICILKLKNNRVLLGRTNGLYELIGGQQIKLRIKGYNDSPVFSLLEQGNSILLGSEGLIYNISENHVLDTLSVKSMGIKMIRNLKLDQNNNLWFNDWGTKNIYFKSINNDIINVSQIAGIKGGSITEIIPESSGCVAVGTISKGFYLFANNHLISYPQTEVFQNSDIHKIIKIPQGGFLLGTADGLAYFDSTTQTIKSIKHQLNDIIYIRNIISAPGQEFLVATIDKNLFKKFSLPFFLPGNELKIRYTHCSSLMFDSQYVYAGNWDNKILVHSYPDFKYQSSIENIFNTKNNRSRINTIQNDKYGRMWVGSQKGLCIFQRNMSKFFPEGEFQNEEVHSVKNLSDGRMLIVTNVSINLVKYDSTTGFQNDRIILNAINCAAVTGRNEFLVGTSYGLVYLNNKTHIVMSYQDGLLSENINDIFFEQGANHAWIATSEGLMKINLAVLRKGLTPPPEIKLVLINNHSVPKIPELINYFPYDSNSFGLKFWAFNYNNPQKLRYQYKVDDEEWTFSPSNEIQIASLEPGDHVISLRAGVLYQTWGTTKQIRFNIAPPFYRTWWFYGLVVILLTWISRIFIIRHIAALKVQQEAEAELKRKILELQQKALASNLNPHFIFNSLNAIQHFVNSKNTLQANEYLAKFARLMRMHLTMADKTTILLKEELQRLEHYLILEKLRFDDRMDWSIEIESSLKDYEIELPNMIIQPFIENAIWHGIMPSTRKGIVSLVIQTIKTDHLEIIITDNGVGMQIPPSQKTDHDPKGILLIQKRLQLMDPESGPAIFFESSTLGTRIKIRLSPKMFRKSYIVPSPEKVA